MKQNNQNESPAPRDKENNQTKFGDERDRSFMQNLWSFIKKNPVCSLIFISLIISISWASIKISILENQFKKERIGLTADYELKIDQLKLKNIMFSSKVFSWSVRSELIRENKENLSELFTSYVKGSEANLAQLVDYKSNKIIISTDRQFEGNKFIIPPKMNLNQQVKVESGKKTTLYTPIMGFNERIGLLIVEFKK